MKVQALVLALAPALAAGRVTEFELLDYDSVADPAAVVAVPAGAATARFTVLTSRLIRMEQAKDSSGQFEDRGTLAVLNRKLDVPKFTHSVAPAPGGEQVLTIQTDDVTLTYTVGKAFAADTLAVSFGAKRDGRWAYGAANDGNLLGTIKSLDELGPISLNCTENNGTQIHDETLHCEWGLVSRSGWSIYDDSLNYCLGAGDWWDGDSSAAANVDDADLYGFFHGTDYKGALQDFTAVAGKIAMVPRAASGVWWTRWFDFTDGDARGVVDQYRARSYPLDVFVLDMDWHRKNSWTGYSFDNSLFPDEAQFMAALHDQNLILAANLHDDVGIGPWENKYDYMAKLMGTPNGTNVPFTMCTNTTYTHALEDVVLGSLESSRLGGELADGGMDFWWIDWQQGGNHGGCAGLKQNPTIWTNKIRCTDAKRRALAAAGGKKQLSADTPIGRNMVLARWGGMGTHRYQVGFSGDVQGLTWDNLAYQPYFTLTAANVGYGYWSHDIEQPAADYEMGVRWVQWAAHSPVFRSHERGMSGGGCADTLQTGQARSQCSIVEPWNVPQLFAEANRLAMRRRLELTPYIYTAARQAFDTGVGLVRPMYYEYPEIDAAYGATPQGNFSQYFFGDDMIAAPVVVQSESDAAPTSWEAGVTTTTVWLPPGNWYEESTGVVHTGADATGTTLTKAYDISETPVFVRAGAIVPSIRVTDGDTVGVAGRQYTNVEFAVYPGSTKGKTRVYEDDGSTTNYVHGSYAYLDASYTVDGSELTFTAQMDSEGTPSDASVTPNTRQMSLRIKSASAPSQVTVNGVAVPNSRSNIAGSGTWHYCQKEMAVVVNAPEQLSSHTLTIVVTTTSDFASSAKALDGVKGHIAHANIAKRSLDLTRKTVGAHDPAADHLKKLASVGSKLSYLAATAATDKGSAFAAQVASLPQMVKDALSETSGMAPFKENPRRLSYALALLQSVVSA